jgi:NAD(P)-dependent dehydrogenase (short-subunit alcohol dehydrogenase family)
MTSSALGPVAVVTGSSRGAGRGIAIALGSHGYTVYVTGRTEKAGEAVLAGTIYETAAAVTAAGGTGVAVRVDHRVDEQVRALFEQIGAEAGRLDILVNNAALVRDELQQEVPFWDKPLSASTDLIEVGIRSSLVASYFAAPLLLQDGGGLVVFTSAPGAVHYQYGAAYGAHKASLDKFAADMAVDFEPFGVAAISIWMGAVLTERVLEIMASGPQFAFLDDIGESPEFTGHIIAALAEDPDIMSRSGQTIIGAEIAREYGITDRDGRQPPSFGDLMHVQPANYHGRIQQ